MSNEMKSRGVDCYTYLTRGRHSVNAHPSTISMLLLRVWFGPVSLLIIFLKRTKVLLQNDCYSCWMAMQDMRNRLVHLYQNKEKVSLPNTLWTLLEPKHKMTRQHQCVLNMFGFRLFLQLIALV